MKILVIFTGGTIGSSIKDEFISLDNSTKNSLLNSYKDKKVEFTMLSPYNILSENLSAKELNTLILTIKKNLPLDYDGIIVTHGTDTIQYTASMLSLVINSSVPIVLVSANYPLEDSRSNGKDNFKSAVEFIKSNKVGGVFVCYKNSGEKETNIHLGSSVITHSEAKDELFSLTEPFAKVYKDEVLIVNKKYQKGNSDIELTLVESPNVLMITSFPGDNFNYSLEGVSAVIIKPYHSGTLNTYNIALKSFLMRAKDIKTPVFICNFDDKKCYETVKAYKDLELIVLPFCTIPAIYSKIWIAVSKKEDIKEFVLREIANEFIN